MTYGSRNPERLMAMLRVMRGSTASNGRIKSPQSGKKTSQPEVASRRPPDVIRPVLRLSRPRLLCGVVLSVKVRWYRERESADVWKVETR